ncbi:MAG: PilZ domain-containing protein [Candidatus Omnitrophota bacterium]
MKDVPDIYAGDTVMGSDYSGSERRRGKRVRVSLSVIYRINEPLAVRLLTANKEIKATMIDLSKSGMAIFTDYEIPVNTVLMIRFTLFKVEKDDVSFYGPVEITGEIKYCVKEVDECRLGVQFISISDKDKQEIENFAAMAINLTKKNPQQDPMS